MRGLYPLAAGNRWTYHRLDGESDPLTFALGAPERMKLGCHGEHLAWPLENPLDQGVAVVALDDRVTIYRATWVGARGMPDTTIDAEYRWEGDANWDFAHAGGGCVVTTVEVTRRGIERITVPAGSFDCLRFDLNDGRYRDETHWLCEGIGLVKRVERGLDSEGGLALIEARLV